MKEVINTAFSEYPAQSYGLVLWSHGEGWLAKSQNKTRWWGQDGGSNYMDISELKDVLRNAPHLSFLLFDAFAVRIFRKSFSSSIMTIRTRSFRWKRLTEG